MTHPEIHTPTEPAALLFVLPEVALNDKAA